MNLPPVFSAAERAYVVANTPLFLLRNLLNDPMVFDVAREDSDEIFAELVAACNRQPATLTDAVIPFILLVALSRRGDVRHLDQSRQLRPQAKPHWFAYLAEMLVEITRPSTQAT